MPLNNLGLGFVFTARDLASNTMAQLERRFSSLDERVTEGSTRMTGAFRRLGLGLAMVTAGATTLTGALSLAHAAGPFEQGLASVGAITRATTQQLQSLRQAALQAGIDTQFSPTEAVEGLQSLATAGQTATQATQTLIPVLDLAAGSLGQLGVAQSAEAVVGTLNAYGLVARDAVQVTDKLLRITQLTNFQARDFEAGLSKAAATGAVFRQNLDDVLITMGLLRNRNIDASSSATAFREALRRVGAERRAQQAVIGAGVQIFEAETGQMRSIVDIMNDFATETSRLTEAERNRRIVTAFGARGLLAFNAVLNASYTTMQDGRQVTLRGVDAIAALRTEMTDVTGTASKFRDQLLDTFEGQKTLLQGTLQTFAIVLGTPFATLFKPVVRTIVQVFNGLLRAFQTIPESIQRGLAGLVLVGSVLVMLVGGLIAAKASVVIFALALKALGLTVGGLAALFLPALGVMAALGLVTTGFIVAFRRNLGGFADFVRNLGRRIVLVFQALKQVFEQGGFSGVVRQALGRLEHRGLKRFVVSLYQIGFRIRRVWEDVVAGFKGTLEDTAPVFRGLMRALQTLGREMGALVSMFTGAAAGIPSAHFRSFGEVVGAMAARGVEGLVRLMTFWVRMQASVLAGLRHMQGVMGPVFRALRGAVTALVQVWGQWTGASKNTSQTLVELGQVGQMLGQIFGRVLGLAVTTLTLALVGLVYGLRTVLMVALRVKSTFVTLIDFIGGVAEKVRHLFVDGIPQAVTGTLRSLRSWASGMMQVLSRIVHAIEGLGQTMRQGLSGLSHVAKSFFPQLPSAWFIPPATPFAQEGSLDTVQRAEEPTRTPEHAALVMPAVAAVSGRTSAWASLASQILASQTPPPSGDSQPPVQVDVQIDGETIARTTHRALQEDADRTFSPLPAY